MNKYILGGTVFILLALAFLSAAPAAKAADIDWGVTITIPGNNYGNNYYSQHDVRISCREIRNKYERAMNNGRYNRARYWEDRWYDNGCNYRRGHHAYNNHRQQQDHYWHRPNYNDQHQRRHYRERPRSDRHYNNNHQQQRRHYRGQDNRH